MRCHGNEYGDLMTLFHFSSIETFFLQYASFNKKQCQINKLYFPLTHISLASIFGGTYADSVDPDQTPQNAASDQGLHCFLQKFL